MRKTFCKISMGILIILMSAGCDDSDQTTSQSGSSTTIGVRGSFFSYMLTDNPKDESSVKPNRQLGVYMLEEETGLPIGENCNILYQSTDGSEVFQAVRQEQALRTPENGSLVNIMAYAPYKETLEGNNYPLEFTNQDAPDLQLYRASKSNVLHTDHSKANLELRPVLSKALFKLIPAKEVKQDELKDASIRLDGMFTRASFNVLDGVMNEGSDVQPINRICNAQCETTALLLPSNTVQGYKLTLTLPHMEESTRECSLVDLDGLHELLPGMQYMFNIVVEPSSMKISVEQSPIGNWGTKGENQDVDTGNINENFLRSDVQDFEEGDLLPTKKYDDVPAETWFYRHHENIHPTDNFARIVKDETLNKKVVNFKMPQDAGVTAADKVVGYHALHATKGKFKVQFKAKVVGDAVDMKCYLRCSTGRYLVTTSGHGTGSATIVSDNYRTYSIEFDFNRTTANTWDNDKTEKLDATDADLKNIYITFAFNHKASEMKMYDLQLLKSK